MKNFLIKVLILALTFVSNACKETQEISPTTTTTTGTTTTNTNTTTNNYISVNKWVHEVMTDAYFWYDQMPALTTLNTSQNPDDFFEKLVYKRETVDRFSGITDDIDALQQEFDGVNKIFGIRFALAYLDNTQTSIGLFLSYVIKGSPAEKVGLKRGDIITKVNGTQLTATNYSTIIGSSDTQTFTLGKVTNGSIVSDDANPVSITKAEVTEDPVAFYAIIDKPESGKKIGYLLYTQFIPGVDGVDASKYDNELRTIFGEFKAKGVNEFVVDLRLNGGGYISSAETLASLIGKNISTSNVFYQEQWNTKYQAYFTGKYGSDYFKHKFKAEPNNIGSQLSRVFVLTSQGTASASELVINGLRPYMNVITVGDHTYGKNLFGTLIGDDQKRWKWGMYVMLGQTANSRGESTYGTSSGISADYAIEDNVIPFRAFADDTEPLFQKVLQIIGVPVSQNPNVRIGAAKQVNRLSTEHFADDLKLNEKRMIRKGIDL